MTDKNIVYFITIPLVIGFIFGLLFFKGCLVKTPPLLKSHTDTLYVQIPPITKIENHYVNVDVIHDISSNKTSYKTKDSLLINQDGVKGKVVATVILDSLGAKWSWLQELQLPPQLHIIDSIYVPQQIEVPRPFYQDTWFYVAFVETVVGIIVVIKTIGLIK
jgi:hypothetical protein